ncbi:hypothetical protein KY337_02790, partial [Candidatus Woesearchaeota archaeon]|nr:hypothetical protein [Candidatus Woesearchaeota archaeon]
DFHMTFNFETGEIDGRLSGSAEGNKGHSLGDFEGRINGVIDGYRFSGTVPLTITYHQEGCQVSHPDPKNADEYWEGVFKSKPTSQTVQVEGTLTGDFFIDDTPVKLTGEDEVFSGWIEISIDELPADWPYDKAPYFYVGCPNCEFPFTR